VGFKSASVVTWQAHCSKEWFAGNCSTGLLQVVSLIVRQNFWFQHDGTPMNCGEAIRQSLSPRLPGRWIRRRGPNSWAPRKTDVIPIYVGLCVLLKEQFNAVSCDKNTNSRDSGRCRWIRERSRK
jgi:hypothetical protein